MIDLINSTICFLLFGLLMCVPRLWTLEIMDPMLLPKRELVQGFDCRYPTLNQKGFIFMALSPVANAFLEREAKPDKEVLEIGAGFNNVPLHALEKDVGHFTANDMSLDHLEILATRIKEFFGVESQAKFEHLTLWKGKAPEDFPPCYGTFDAVLLDKVLHFSPLEQAREILAWIHNALKDRGRIYVVTAPIQNPIYAAFVPLYQARKERGEKIPGFFHNIRGNLDETVIPKNIGQYFPDDLLLLDQDTLKILLEEAGFQVEDHFFMTLPQADETTWEQGDPHQYDFLGMIAVKRSLPSIGT